MAWTCRCPSSWALPSGSRSRVLPVGYLTHFKEDYPAMNAVYETYFDLERRPARTCVGVAGLALDARVEIDLLVRRP